MDLISRTASVDLLNARCFCFLPVQVLRAAGTSRCFPRSRLCDQKASCAKGIEPGRGLKKCVYLLGRMAPVILRDFKVGARAQPIRALGWGRSAGTRSRLADEQNIRQDL